MLDIEEAPQNASTNSRDAAVRAPSTLELNGLWPYELPRAAAMSRAQHLRQWRVETVPFPSDPMALLPADASLIVNAKEGRTCHTAAEGPDYVLYLHARHGSTEINVAAQTGERAEQILASITARIERPPSTTVGLTLWRWHDGKARSWQRNLDVPAWTDIERNYPSRRELEALMNRSSVVGTGRLMLWTGEPGTGKTNAIRALARSWRSWCDAHLIIDPERFFGDASYLIEVMSRDDENFVEDEDGEETEVPKSRLIICEDADDFIRSRDVAGAGLGRLLNVADGLLGQGLNNIILLTSNTPVTQLDPALLRPGRLLANLEFGRFAPADARAWLDDAAAVIPADGHTLAELYERAGAVARQISRPPPSASSGAYL